MTTSRCRDTGIWHASASTNWALAVALLLSVHLPWAALAETDDGTKWKPEFGRKLEELWKEFPDLCNISGIKDHAVWRERFQQIRAKVPGMADSDDNRNSTAFCLYMLAMPQSEKDELVKENAAIKQQLLNEEAIYEMELQKAAEDKQQKEMSAYAEFRKKQTNDLLDKPNQDRELQIMTERKTLEGLYKDWDKMQGDFQAQEKADEAAAHQTDVQGPAEATANLIKSRALGGGLLLIPGAKQVIKPLIKPFLTDPQ